MTGNPRPRAGSAPAAVGNGPLVRIADASDIHEVGLLMAAAFEDDAVTRWLIDDDPADLARIMPPYFASLAELGRTGGTVYVAGDFEAIAVWIDASDAQPPPPAEPEPAAVHQFGRHVERFHRLEHALHGAQIGLPPHQHLWFLATRPQLQGRGLGAALLEEHHRLLDSEGTPASLDASSLNSRRLYLRAGYQDLGAPYEVARGGPTMWPMWRPPDGAGAGGQTSTAR